MYCGVIPLANEKLVESASGTPTVSMYTACTANVGPTIDYWDQTPYPAG